MPLAALLFFNIAAGLAVALAATRELRASPRSVPALRSFAALCVHEALVAVPAAFYLLARHTDWMLGYVIVGARVPSALLLVTAVGFGVAALGGFFVGARWMRDHRPLWPAALAAGLCLVALVGLAVMRARAGVVGTTAQYRGGFGLVPFWSSRASTAVLLVAMVQGSALAWLGWNVRERASR
jgi:hypothetical protein